MALKCREHRGGSCLRYSLLLCLCLLQTVMKNICKIARCQRKCKTRFILLSNNRKGATKKNRGNTCLNVCNTYCYLSSKDNKGSNKSGSVKSLIIWCPIKILFITRVVNNALSGSGLSANIYSVFVCAVFTDGIRHLCTSSLWQRGWNGACLDYVYSI